MRDKILEHFGTQTYLAIVPVSAAPIELRRSPLFRDFISKTSLALYNPPHTDEKCMIINCTLKGKKETWYL